MKAPFVPERRGRFVNLPLGRLFAGQFDYVVDVVDDRLERPAFLMLERQSVFVSSNGLDLGFDLFRALQHYQPAL